MRRELRQARRCVAESRLRVLVADASVNAETAEQFRLVVEQLDPAGAAPVLKPRRDHQAAGRERDDQPTAAEGATKQQTETRDEKPDERAARDREEHADHRGEDVHLAPSAWHRRET